MLVFITRLAERDVARTYIIQHSNHQPILQQPSRVVAIETFTAVARFLFPEGVDFYGEAGIHLSKLCRI